MVTDPASCAVFGGQDGQHGPAGSGRLTALIASKLHKPGADIAEKTTMNEAGWETTSQEAARQSFLFKRIGVW